DGIRDFHVTGVQTCALPISLSLVSSARASPGSRIKMLVAVDLVGLPPAVYWALFALAADRGAGQDSSRSSAAVLGSMMFDQTCSAGCRLRRGGVDSGNPRSSTQLRARPRRRA